MTYNEWKDELKSNLLSVSEEERRRVFDYYAEAYADRREAGFSEREIIEEFGAPYDAAKRILSEREEDCVREEDVPKKERQKRTDASDSFFEPPPAREAERETESPPKREEKDKSASFGGTLLFVLLCVLLWAPVFGIFMAGFGITVTLGVLPVSLLAGGVASIGAGVAAIASGAGIAAVTSFGTGLAAIGLGLLLFPLCIKGISLLWRLVKTVFGYLRSFLGGRRKA